MESNQKYLPEFGYISPKRTRGECKNPAFMDKNLHRVGVFADKYLDDGLRGYSCIFKCVNCGKRFKSKGFDRIFIPCRRLND